MKNVLIFGSIFVVVYAAALALSGLIIMLVANIILNYYDVKPLSYGVAIAVAFLLSIITGVFSQSKKD